MVLSLQNKQIPPHLHLEKLNPYIKIANTPLKIPTKLEQWIVDEETRLAGISAFGFGGTNAHVILEEAPTPIAVSKEVECSPHLLTLSAKSEQALHELAHNYHTYLQSHPKLSLRDVCNTANTGRTHFNHRLAVIADSPVELQKQLGVFVAGQDAVGLTSGQVTSRKGPKIAFLFTGQGSQYVGMGRQLYEQEPVFRQALDQCADLLKDQLEQPLLEILYNSEPVPDNSALIDQTAYTQPVLFALEYALAQLWQSYGITPDLVLGHSVGEYVAATIAGVFSLEEGLKLIAHRGKLMQALPPNGQMVSVLADELTVRKAIDSCGNQVAIAAINGPKSIVISGDKQQVERVKSNLEAQKIKTKQLQVSHGFHSPLMEPMLAEFTTIAAQVTYHQPKIPVIANVTGEKAGKNITTPEYWVNHVRQPVRFAQSMETFAQGGNWVFIEIGPKPILLGMGRQCLPSEVGVWLPSLRPRVEDRQQMLTSLAQLYIRGVKVNWSGLSKGYNYSKVSLPTYPFQRQRYWIETTEEGQQKTDARPHKNVFTPIYNLLYQGETKLVAEELEKLRELSEDEIKLLPRLLELLVEQHQKHLEIVSTTSHNGASNTHEKFSNRNSLLKEAEYSTEILTAEPETRKSLLKSYISKLLAKVMGIPPATLDWQKRLSELGLDSLMATELRKSIESNLEVVVPVEYFAELNIEQFLTQILFSIEQKFPQTQLPQTKAIMDEQKPPLYSVETSGEKEQKWFKLSPRNSQPLFRLFCFPHAGASASIFNSWSDKFSSQIEICPIQLPGRGNRLKEPPFTKIKPLIQTLAPLLKPYLDVPFAFFGHSMGALLSFELARELRRQNCATPVHLFVGGYRAPQIPDLNLPIYKLPETKFIEVLSSYQGISEHILQDPYLMQAFIPIFRADFEILDTYFYTQEEPLESHI